MLYRHGGYALLGLSTREAALSHPKVGASWKGFVIQQIVRLLAASPEQCFQWSTHSGAELDLLVMAGNRRYGFEVERAEVPRPTQSMRSAFETLGLSGVDGFQVPSSPASRAISRRVARPMDW